MGKVFASKGVCSRKLSFEEQQAQKPLWLQTQEASRAVMDAALTLASDDYFMECMAMALGSPKELALYKAAEDFKRLTKK